MKILIVSPLLPPDLADPAPYVKELARRLGKSSTVSILAYNHVPESIEGVNISVVEKSLPNLVRLALLLIKLLIKSYQNDIVLIQNGISTEIPTIIASLIYHKKIYLFVSDPKVKVADKNNHLHMIIHRLAEKTAYRVINLCNNDGINMPKPRPEILPFKEYPTNSMMEYEQSWEEHLKQLQNLWKK